MIEDASGILTPERTRELISIVQRNCAGIPLEFHCHCNSGLAPLCYLEAIQAGVTTVHTAVAPLANGTSLPSTESILKNARRLGFTSDLDEDALAAVSAHFRKIAEKENLPIGAPREYDLFHFDHQVPGGMMTNLTRQLRELGMEHRLDEILQEVVQVRKEFGYPVMATPYSQIVGVQAVENVVSGERYKKIPDETIKYALQLLRAAGCSRRSKCHGQDHELAEDERISQLEAGRISEIDRRTAPGNRPGAFGRRSSAQNPDSGKTAQESGYRETGPGCVSTSIRACRILAERIQRGGGW